MIQYKKNLKRVYQVRGRLPKATVGSNLGFSTIEIMIALFLVVLTISATTMVVFGGQSIFVDSQTSGEARHKAQEILESAMQRGRENYDSVTPTVGTYVNGITYNTSLEIPISGTSQCGKQIVSKVSWQGEHGRTLDATLLSSLGDLTTMANLNGNCNTTPPTGDDWKKPNKLDVNVAGMQGSGTGIDIKNKIIFLTSKITGANKDDFFIIDATDKNNPIPKGFEDFSDGAGGDGLEDIDVSGNYAFVANDEDISIKQLKVIDVSNLNLPSLVNELTLPGVSGSCPHTCPGGRSIYFYKNRIYMGTHRLTAAGAAEFHVFSVTDPTVPVWLGSKGGAFLGDVLDHNVNDIVIKEQTIGGVTRIYAYLVTSGNNSEVIVLNVTNPAGIPDPAGTLNTGSVLNLGGTGGSDLDATKIFIMGNMAFVGRERATGSEKDFFILNISDPSNLIILGSVKLNIDNGAQVSGISANGNLVFIGTTDSNDPFLVWDITNPALPVRWEDAGCDVNFSTFVTDLYLEDNLIYTSMEAQGHNPKILEPLGGSCT